MDIGVDINTPSASRYALGMAKMIKASNQPNVLSVNAIKARLIWLEIFQAIHEPFPWRLVISPIHLFNRQSLASTGFRLL